MLARLAELEAASPGSGWSHLRIADRQTAGRGASELAAVAKIAAVKALVRAAWVRASAQARSDAVSAADFDASVTLPTVAGAADGAEAAEHLRVVLSVIEDEMYRNTSSPLKPLEDAALERLVDAAVNLWLLMTKQSAQIADADSSPRVEGEHVVQAYAQISRVHNLRNPPRRSDPLSREQTVRQLAPLSRDLLEAKAGVDNTPDQVAAELSRDAPIPIAKDGLEVLYATLRAFSQRIVRGIAPRRADNFTLDDKLAPPRRVGRDYVDAAFVYNAAMQRLPYRALDGGDATVAVAANPALVEKTRGDLAPVELRLTSERLARVRKSGLGWIVLYEAWSERGYAIDPFAAEYLSEILTTMTAAYLARAEQLAEDLDRPEIDADVAKRALSRSYVFVPFGQQSAPAKRAGAPRFRDASAASGLAVESSPVATFRGSDDLQRVAAGGIAVGDVDGDGYSDVYLSGETLGRLYINRGKSAPGTFADRTERWGLPTDVRDGHGALLFDFEGDGDLDLLVVREGHPSALYLQTAGKFEDAAARLGLRTTRAAHAACVFDYDRDGDLDIYIGYYGSSPNQLWRNDGDKLVEAAGAAGVDSTGWTLAAGAFDYEMDGDLDLYVANEFGANALYRNDGKGAFSDVGEQTGTGDRGRGASVDVADVDGDARWDLYVTGIDVFGERDELVFPENDFTFDIDESVANAYAVPSGNKLFLGAAAARLAQSSEFRFEPAHRGWGWDASFFDYDNDGDDDLYIANGWVSGAIAGDQRNQLYVNERGHFELASPKSPEAFAGNSRSVAPLDIDLDGDIDLVVNNFGRAPVVLVNTQRQNNHWVRLQLAGHTPNTGAIGALVTIEGPDLKVLRQVTAGRGYLAQSELAVTAGVGKAKQVSVAIRWPDGSEQKLTGLRTNRAHAIKKP